MSDHGCGALSSGCDSFLVERSRDLSLYDLNQRYLLSDRSVQVYRLLYFCGCF